MPVNERQAVQAVPVQPPRFGLLVAAPVTPMNGVRWQAGVKWTAESCAGSGRAAVGRCGSTDALVADRDANFVNADPFLVWAADECSIFGAAARDWSGRVTRQLEATQSFQIAEELWTGELSAAEGLDNRALTDSASDTVTNGPTTVLDAFACLEAGLASCGQGRRGMIHVTPQVLVHLMSSYTVVREGTQYLSPLGNIVVADAGYDGSGPGGTPATTSQWGYATGIVAVTLEAAPELVPGSLEAAQIIWQGLDRSVNTLGIRAQKLAMYQWDECCHLAAEFNLAPCLVGGAS